MFCPKCGTPGKGKRFCTRCGLQLALVRYQGVPVTNRILVVSPSAPTIRMETELATQKFAAPTVPNEIARVTALATMRLRPSGAQSPRRFTPILIGALLLLVVAASGFWWRNSQGQVVQAQTVVLAENRPHNSSEAKAALSGATHVEPKQTPAPNYEWAIIEDQTQGVSEAEAALLADEKMAVIAPAGQLALDLRAGRFFGNGPQVDLQLYGSAQERVAYTIFVRNDPTAAWQRIDINRKTFAAGVAGHDMGHHGLRQAKQVLIRNDAPRELHIDAVSALHLDVVNAVAKHHVKLAKSPARRPIKRAVVISKERRETKSEKKKDRD